MYEVARFYLFTDFPDYVAFQLPLKTAMQAHGVKGTVLLAAEGINGTIAGPRGGLEACFAIFTADPRFAALKPAYTSSDTIPFERVKVKAKREIVTMKQPVDMSKTGIAIAPQDWNALISDPNTVIIDTRNDFEYDYGHFQNALNPNTERFSHFPDFVHKHAAQLQGKKIAMYCTGGIRCEKASAWMQQEGFADVYQLKGGILGYLETVPEADSLWQGKCFVFDDREAV